jgi:hypothetical protein
MSDERLSEGDIACIDAIKTVLEILIARKLMAPEQIADLYRQQANGYMMKRLPVAAAAMMLLVNFLEDEDRNRARALLQAPPEGKA